MDFLLQLFQIARAPGTGAELWLDSSSLLTTLVMILVLGLVAIVLPLPTLKGLSRGRRTVMVLLRVSLVVLLGGLLLKPSVVLLSPITAREKLAVLIDASRSMSITPEVGKPSRWERAVEMVQGGPFVGMGKKYELELYTFGAEMSVVSGAASLSALKPDAEESDLGEAFQQMAREGRDLTLGGVVVLSDGIERGSLRKRWREQGDDGLRSALEPFNPVSYTHLTLPTNREV